MANNTVNKTQDALKLALVAQRILKAWDDPHGMPALCQEMNALRPVLADHIVDANKMAEQPARQEPVAWLIDNDYTTVFRDIAEVHRNKGANVEPLYTSPPASKPWVGLTNQELIDLTAIYSGAPLYCAIEAKLKEKNT